MTIWHPDLSTLAGPRYLAIAEALARDIAAGTLKPGDRLPPHRDLAYRLGVTVGTVTRAYGEAERRGLIAGEVGRGTYVQGGENAGPFLLRMSDEPGLIDLSMNCPARDEFADLLAQGLEGLLRSPRLARLMEYQPHAGDAFHREAGAAWIARTTGLETAPERVVVTNAAQHAMTTTLAALARPGDTVLTEEVTYPGIMALAHMLQLRLHPLAMDEHGLRPDALEAAARSGVSRVLYCMPTLHNPTTTLMPEERRRDIAALARQYGLNIIEDDVYGFLPESALPPLTAFAPERSWYIISASKRIAPGLRIGYVLTPPGQAERTATGVHATTWMASPIMGELTSLWIENGTADRMLAWHRAEAASRQRLARALLPKPLLTRSHAEGYHLWLMVPEPWRASDFVAEARRRGVALTGGETFTVGRAPAPHAVRVCLGAPRSQAVMEKGVEVLAELLAEPGAAGRSVL